MTAVLRVFTACVVLMCGVARGQDNTVDPFAGKWQLVTDAAAMSASPLSTHCRSLVASDWRAFRATRMDTPPVAQASRQLCRRLAIWLR